MILYDWNDGAFAWIQYDWNYVNDGAFAWIQYDYPVDHLSDDTKRENGDNYARDGGTSQQIQQVHTEEMPIPCDFF